MTAPDRDDGDHKPIRVSDADRNEAVQRLKVFYGEGRLTLEEFNTRVDEAFNATTNVELDRVFQDLPRIASPVPAPIPSRQPRAHRVRSRVHRAVPAATPAAICTVIWAMTGHGYFWPEWVWLGTSPAILASLRSSGRAHHRPADLHSNGGDGATLGPALTADMRSTSGPVIGAGDGERRIVLTAVFADIVGSTEKAAALGDRQWGEVLSRFEDLVERKLDTFQGRKLFTKGDEVVGTFRSPANAIGYACALRDAVRSLQLDIRAGMHTGELTGRHRDLHGIALHVGQRVSAAAAPGEILVTSTVRDLALGSGIPFVYRGEHQLRGLTDAWRLFAVGVEGDADGL
jgi:class 3 adenylate cyclase